MITVHGFRSTFRDWAAERTNFANHVVEMALRTLSATRSRPAIAVAICSTNAGSLWKRGQAIVVAGR